LVESISGNQNLEIRWRLAKLSEAKALVTHTANIWQRIPIPKKNQEEWVKQLASRAAAGSTAVAPAQGGFYPFLKQPVATDRRSLLKSAAGHRRQALGILQGN
jgi:hypothetical protein